MESEAGWSILLEKNRDGRRVYYRYEDTRYSINNQPLSEIEINQLKETIYMLNRFKGMPQFSWMEEILARFESVFKLRGTTTSIVGFEENPYLKGLNLFSDIFNAIVNKQTLQISYQKFGKESKEYIFHPYFLKQYNNRWFLFGLCDHLKEKKSITNLALDRLDRIERITYANTPFIENKDIEFNEYFEDVIGVTVYEKEVEQIILEVDNILFPYILKNLGKVSTGNTPLRKEKKYYNDDYIEWIKSDNITDENMLLSQAKEYLSVEGSLKRIIGRGYKILW